MHVVTTKSDKADEQQAQVKKRAAELEEQNVPIILNPFFAKLWPQNSTMEYPWTSPHITTNTDNRAASWRQMQLTSPPIFCVDMCIWYTRSRGRSDQTHWSTGYSDTGITLGNLAESLAACARKKTLQWMVLQEASWWVRSADVVMMPEFDEDSRKDEK